MTTIQAIETHYAGHRFRSRLEARWAVFFKTIRVEWRYESQGFMVNGQPYLPDFLLPDSGTWVEVKGDEYELDHSLMLAAAEQLPYRQPKQRPGPRLLILGPIPEPPVTGDLGWVGIDSAMVWQGSVQDGDKSFACSIQRWDWRCECGGRYERDDRIGPGDACEHLLAFAKQSGEIDDGEVVLQDNWWGFGGYHKELRPQVLANTSCATPVQDDGDEWLKPAPDEYAEVSPKLAAAYLAARSARFEHGEKG